MKIAVACGGTGGHIFPGLATAQVLQARGHEVTLWLAGRDVEASSIEGWQGATVRIRASGFPSGFSPVRSMHFLWQLLSAGVEAWKTMRRQRPDVLLCMGSYASVAPCLAAWLLGIPVVLHEANAVPGRAISFLSRFATRVAVGFAAAAPYFSAGKAAVTGFPLREGFLPASRKREMNEPFTLLVMGGSQGARVLNTRMPEVAAALQTRLNGAPLRVIHLAGRAACEAVRQRYRENSVAAEVFSFSTEMPRLYASADLAVARSGAATCTELAICGLPAVLVPLPHAPRNHQMRNAEFMASSGGMRVLPESEFTVENMTQRLYTLIDDPAGRQRMSEALLKTLPADGAQRLADLVEAAGGALI